MSYLKAMSRLWHTPRVRTKLFLALWSSPQTASVGDLALLNCWSFQCPLPNVTTWWCTQMCLDHLSASFCPSKLSVELLTLKGTNNVTLLASPESVATLGAWFVSPNLVTQLLQTVGYCDDSWALLSSLSCAGCSSNHTKRFPWRSGNFLNLHRDSQEVESCANKVGSKLSYKTKLHLLDAIPAQFNPSNGPTGIIIQYLPDRECLTSWKKLPAMWS